MYRIKNSISSGTPEAITKMLRTKNSCSTATNNSADNTHFLPRQRSKIVIFRAFVTSDELYALDWLIKKQKVCH